MYYFDNKYLAQYIDQEMPLWVYDGYEWSEVADESDLRDPVEGYAYDTNGRGKKIIYKNIEKIKVGNRQFTLDQLQAMRTGEPPEETDKEPAKPSGDEGGMGDEPPAEEEPKKGKEPDLSWHSPIYNIGRDLIREHMRNKNK